MNQTPKKLYKISRSDAVRRGALDHTRSTIFVSAVVAADTPDQARMIHPAEGFNSYDWQGPKLTWLDNLSARRSWDLPENLKVEFIGTAAPGTKFGVILQTTEA